MSICPYCGKQRFAACDKQDVYSEVCLDCNHKLVVHKNKLLEDFECSQCGCYFGEQMENEKAIAIKCAECGHLTTVLRKQTTFGEKWSDSKPRPVDTRPKCPHCGSTNISKISTTSRFISTSIFGLASSKVGKTMECKKCGYKW